MGLFEWMPPSWMSAIAELRQWIPPSWLSAIAELTVRYAVTTIEWIVERFLRGGPPPA